MMPNSGEGSFSEEGAGAAAPGTGYNWRAHLTPFWQAFWAKMDRRAAGLPPEPEALVNDGRLAHWLERAGHSIRRRIDREVHLLGLGASQAALLLEIGQLRHPTHELCARRMRVSRGVVTRLLANLELLELVEVRTFEFDRRVRVPQLTSAGHERLQAVREALQRVEDAIAAGLGPEDRALLMSLLARVEEATRWS